MPTHFHENFISAYYYCKKVINKHRKPIHFVAPHKLSVLELETRYTPFTSASAYAYAENQGQEVYDNLSVFTSKTATTRIWEHSGVIQSSSAMASAGLGIPNGALVEAEISTSYQGPQDFFSSGGWAKASAGARWGDCITVSNSPILSIAPYITLTFSVAEYHDIENHVSQGTSIIAGGGILPYVIQSGPGTFSHNVTLARAGTQFWRGDWFVDIDMVLWSFARSASRSASISLVSAKLADGTDPEILQFCGTQTDYAPTNIIRNEQGAVTISYSVTRAPLTKATSVALYWASGESLASVIGGPVFSTSVQRSTGLYGPIEVPASTLSSPPIEATHMLVVTDPDQLVVEADESNNVMAIQVRRPDLAAGSVIFDESKGGAKFDYTISGTNLTQGASVQFVWSDAPTSTSGIPAAPSRVSETSVGSHKIELTAAEITPAPLDKTYYLVGVIDRENSIQEVREDNNTTSSILIYSATVSWTTDPPYPQKAEPYSLIAAVKNTSPIGLPAFTLDWTEERTSGTTPERPNPRPRNGKFSFSAIGYAQTSEVTQPFEHDWEWIPTTNPLFGDLWKAISGGSLLELVAKLGSPLSTIKNTIDYTTAFIDAIESTKVAETKNEYTYLLESAPGLSIQPAPVSTVTVSVPNYRLVSYGAAVGLLMTGSDIMASGLAELLIARASSGELRRQLTTAAGATIGVGIASLISSGIIYEIAKDPPDFDYRTEVIPRPLIPSFSDVVVDGILLDCFKLQLEYTSLQIAQFESRNKADGAFLSGDYEWQSKQLLAASEFVNRAAIVETKLIGYLAHANKVNALGYTPTAADAVSYLNANGLPGFVTSLLSQAGWSQTAIDELVATLRGATTLSTNPRTSGLLAARAAGAFDSYSSMDQLNHAVQLRVQSLGLPVQSVSEDQAVRLANDRLSIEADIATGIPSHRLSDAIESHIGYIRDLYLQTNNAELGEALDRAYTYMVRFQQLDPSITALDAIVSHHKSSGLISSIVADQLEAELDSAAENLEVGDFASVSAALTSFQAIVIANLGGSINPASGAKLSDFVGYLLPYVTATVPNENNSPTDLVLLGIFVEENLSLDSLVGTLTATDPDVGDTFTYSLVGGLGSDDNAAFTVVGDQLRTAVTFDYEARSNYTIRVKVTDSGSETFEKVFAITISDVAEPRVTELRLLYGTNQSHNLLSSSRTILPWAITGIEAVFSESVTGTLGSLNVTGIGVPTIATFTGSGTNSLRWTFNSPISVANWGIELLAANIRSVLTQEGLDGDGDGDEGGDFGKSTKVLQGDFDENGIVNIVDAMQVRSKIGGAYVAFADIDGDGDVDLNDMNLVRTLIGRTI